MEVKTICVVGLGYICLPSAALLASQNKKVIGCDIQPHIIEKINAGIAHLLEPGLNYLVRDTVSSGNLKAQLSVPAADVFIITVPTPVTEKHEPDISYVKSAVESIAPHLQKKNLVIIESTSPVGTTEKAITWIQQLRPDLNVIEDIYIAYCPERVMPGNILRELVCNDRVIGGINPKSTEQAIAFYKIFVTGECIATTAKTAEMTKLTENAFRDVNIAFANELSMICDQHHIDAQELIALANRHPRVNILQPGPGVGGHCIAVDPWFIVAANPAEAKLIRCAREVNDYKTRYVLKNILKTISTMQEPVIACLGITFKKDVDDLRESPALMIVNQLAEKISGKVLVVEPHIQTLPAVLSQHKNVALTNLEDALSSADIIVLLVAHTVFTAEKLTASHAIIIDVVGVIKRKHAANFAIA